MDELLTFMGAGENDLLTELIKENLAKRVLILNRDVDESIMENYVMYIIKWNEEDKDIPVSKRKPIRFYINSPGGNVFDGELLIDVMLTSKTPIKGVAFGLVASMAYRIFLDNLAIAFWTRTSFSGSRDAVASSKRIMGAFLSSARAMDIL